MSHYSASSRSISSDITDDWKFELGDKVVVNKSKVREGTKLYRVIDKILTIEGRKYSGYGNCLYKVELDGYGSWYRGIKFIRVNRLFLSLEDFLV